VSVIFRVAQPSDVPDIVRLINVAYEVEKSFVSGDRTDTLTVLRLMEKGDFLIARGEQERMAACVYVESQAARGYFGMLAVAPDLQGFGLGARAVEAAEAHARAAGATTMDLRVVSLREELPSFYRKLGYAESGTESCDDPRALKPFHFIRMSKSL